MSQMTATARAGVRSIAQRTASVPRLRVVSGAESRSGGPGFVVFCVGLLVAGLVGLLVLNTALSQGSFTLSSLQATSGVLADEGTSLRTQLREQEAPANLARRAAAQGMVPSASSGFIRLSDGRVLGVAKAASGDERFTVVTPPPAGSAASTTKAADSSVAGAMAAAVQTARARATAVQSNAPQDPTTKR